MNNHTSSRTGYIYSAIVRFARKLMNPLLIKVIKVSGYKGSGKWGNVIQSQLQPFKGASRPVPLSQPQCTLFRAPAVIRAMKLG